MCHLTCVHLSLVFFVFYSIFDLRIYQIFRIYQVTALPNYLTFVRQNVLQVSNYRFALVNSSYCDGNVVNHEKNAKQFFSQWEFNSSTLYFSTLYPNDIHILFIHCMISKRVLLILKNTSQITKNASQFLKKNFPNS